MKCENRSKAERMKPMEREDVTSSNIVSVGYDGDEQILEVEFNGGSVYQYFGVPEDMYQRLMTAESVGRHLGRHIKGVFRCERVE